MRFFEAIDGALINPEFVLAVEINPESVGMEKAGSRHKIIFHFSSTHNYTIGCSNLMSAEREKQKFKEFCELNGGGLS